VSFCCSLICSFDIIERVPKHPREHAARKGCHLRKPDG
jgi:hypothetical protein